MKRIENVLIVGLGAIGSIYATKLYDFNPEGVKVLLDKSRLPRYREDGIVFNRQRYDFDYVLENEKNFTADLIIIATKATTFKQSSRMIRPFVGENTIILSLLNGISSEEILKEKYGEEKVLYSYYLGHASMREGNKIKYDGVGDIYFGELNNQEYTENVKAVRDLFDMAEISYKIPDEMLSAIWQKFVINIGVNQTLAMIRKPYCAFQESLHARNIAFSLMSEAVEIAKKLEIKDCEKFIDNAFDFMSKADPKMKPSMLQDVEAQRLTEVDIFAGEVCRLGKKYGVQTPKNNLALNILTAMA